MAFNNKVQLSGYLGREPRLITKENRDFVVLSVATIDSYPVKQDNETKWEDKETVWHDVFIFRPTALDLARELKKGDKVDISGSISYRPFKDINNISRKQAAIIANVVENISNTKQYNLVQREISEIVENFSV